MSKFPIVNPYFTFKLGFDCGQKLLFSTRLRFFPFLASFFLRNRRNKYLIWIRTFIYLFEKLTEVLSITQWNIFIMKYCFIFFNFFTRLYSNLRLILFSLSWHSVCTHNTFHCWLIILYWYHFWKITYRVLRL
jgi:hypothetical protein